MFTQHKCHVFLHIIREAVYLQIMLFSNGAYLLHNKMGIIPTEMMKDDRGLELFWVNPQPQITVLVGRPPLLPSNVTMIPDPDICFLILLATNMAL